MPVLIGGHNLPPMGEIGLTDLPKSGGTMAPLRSRIAQNVKKPPLTVNSIDFEFFGFNVSIWIPWSPLGPKKS